MLSAGSMVRDCSDIRYSRKCHVANLDTDSVAFSRYGLIMLADWLRGALESADISGAELARRLTRRLGRSIDRAAVNKMMMTRATARTKPRDISAEEMMAIAEITGVAPPAEAGIFTQQIPLVSWVSAGALELADQFGPTQDLRRFAVSDLPPGDWIALEVNGDSMDRISPPGSIIFVNRRETSLIPNACYVLMSEEGEATYKRYRPAPDRFEPVSINTEHEPLYPEGPIKIIGRVRRSVLPM